VQNGSPRDALQQVVYVRISLRGHRRHIRLFCFLFDARFHSQLEYRFRPHRCGKFEFGYQDCARGSELDSLGSIYRDGRLGPTDWRRQASVSYRFSEVSEEQSRPYSLSIAATRQRVTASVNRAEMRTREDRRGQERAKTWEQVLITIASEKR
jgi:hypothetical protein